jgi:predicted amidohydrolase YtcJ
VSATTNGNGHADLILRGGHVYTADAVGRWADAIAVRGGRIAAVGFDDDVRDLQGPSTRVVDVRGGLVLPGFQDAHCHPPWAGVSMVQADLHDGVDAAEFVRLIRQWADDNPGAPWIIGDGWFMDAFEGGNPSKDLLDAAVPDRPVYAESRDGHSVWVNSRALAIAGITRDTPDPQDGVIIRTADGEPQGTLHEGAITLVRDHVPKPTEMELTEGLLRAQAYLHSLGITAWQDAIVEDDTGAVYRRLAEDGRLTARVVGALWWERDHGGEQIDRMVDRRGDYSHGRFRATSIKLMQDGIVENFTAGMTDPYLDAGGNATDNRGKSFVDPEALRRYVTALDAEGFQCHFHAIGDRGVHESLDAIEAARRTNGWNDQRHHIAHIQVIRPEDLPRFRAVGAVANAQPLWACSEGQMENLTIPFLGRERAGWQYPFRSLERAGAVTAMGSDWAVSSPNPLLEMEVAVRRVDPADRGHDPFLPDERISVRSAVNGFTIGTAYVNHLDGETGTIEAGKLADLCVVDRDLFSPEVEFLGDAKVVLTLVDGEPVYRDPDGIDW